MTLRWLLQRDPAEITAPATPLCTKPRNARGAGPFHIGDRDCPRPAGWPGTGPAEIRLACPSPPLRPPSPWSWRAAARWGTAASLSTCHGNSDLLGTPLLTLAGLWDFCRPIRHSSSPPALTDGTVVAPTRFKLYRVQLSGQALSSPDDHFPENLRASSTRTEAFFCSL